jgi:hypothetical protein
MSSYNDSSITVIRPKAKNNTACQPWRYSAHYRKAVYCSTAYYHISFEDLWTPAGRKIQHV